MQQENRSIIPHSKNITYYVGSIKTNNPPNFVMHGGENLATPREHGASIAERTPKAKLCIDPLVGSLGNPEQWREIIKRLAKLTGITIKT